MPCFLRFLQRSCIDLVIRKFTLKSNQKQLQLFWVEKGRDPSKPHRSQKNRGGTNEVKFSQGPRGGRRTFGLDFGIGFPQMEEKGGKNPQKPFTIDIFRTCLNELTRQEMRE